MSDIKTTAAAVHQAHPLTERTLILVKPDGVGKHRVGAVIDRLERAGLRLIGLKMLKLTTVRAEDFYKEHHGKSFYPALIQFMTSAPIVASVWEAPSAIREARALMGATDSLKADSGTLRRDFGTNNRYNLVHGSDSAPSAQREIPFFFTPEELFSYGDNDWNN